jgi:import inner membrane translocase subunit TIM8
MDLGGASNSLAGLDLTKLSDRDKQELQQFVVNESQKARIQSCMCNAVPMHLHLPF